MNHLKTDMCLKKDGPLDELFNDFSTTDGFA